MTLTDTPASIRSGPPQSGADTRAVLAELGYGPAAVDALIESGAAAEATAPPGWLT